ncbi:MAG: ABC transporter substrate-binding protein [Parvibaculaceae bacterium]
MTRDQTPFTTDRRRFLKSSLLAGLALPPLAQFIAGAASAAEEVRRGGTLTIATTAPTAVDPHQLQDPGGRAFVQPIVNYLVRVTPDLQVVPELATAWESQDAKVWTVTLRQGVKFHNGRDFTADDVVATFERLVDPKVASAARSAFSFLDPGKTTKVDSHTVRFELNRALGDFPYSLFTYQAGILPADWPGDFAKNPIGTGPFKLTRYVPKETAEYERFEGYWEDGQPYLDRVRLAFFEDTGAQIAALQSGAVDMMQSIPLDSIEALGAADHNIDVLAASSATYAQLAMRVDQKPFDDKRVRQALAYTLDRELMVKSLWSGYADLGNDHLIAPIYPLSKGVKLEQRKQDYDKAKALLAEAGYPDGIDVELRTHPIFGLPQYAQAVQEMAKPANIRIELKVEQDDLYYQHWNTTPFALEAWIHRPSPGQLLNIGYRCGADWNVPHWCNKAFDDLVTELDATVEQGKRDEIAGKIAEVMQDDTPAIVAFFYKNLRPVSHRVKGLAGDPTDFLDLRKVWLAA